MKNPIQESQAQSRGQGRSQAASSGFGLQAAPRSLHALIERGVVSSARRIRPLFGFANRLAGTFFDGGGRVRLPCAPPPAGGADPLAMPRRGPPRRPAPEPFAPRLPLARRLAPPLLPLRRFVIPLSPLLRPALLSSPFAISADAPKDFSHRPTARPAAARPRIRLRAVLRYD